MRITEKEIESVSKLEPFERYQYFIKRVADSEKMYTLINKEGNFALSDVENNTLFSVWSASEFALACATGEWIDFSVKEISLEEFENDIIDKVEESGWLINVFSIKSKSGFVVDINEFAKDLSDEMKKYH